MKKFFLTLMLLTCSPVAAQWQVPNNTIPIGRGPGVSGFNSVPNTGTGTSCLVNTAPPTFGSCAVGLNILSSFSGSTGNAQLVSAIASGVKYVQLTAEADFFNTTPIALPTSFVFDCNGYYIVQGASVSPSLFTMGEGSQFRNCKMNGNGTLFTGDMLAVTSGNNQRLVNVDIVNTYGYNLNFSANVGGNFSWIGGSFNRTCSTAYTISSGTYNSTSGLVTLTMSASVPFASGAPITAESLGGTGAFDSLRGPYTSVSVSGLTVTYTAATGLGSAAITSGFLLSCPNNVNDAITFASSESGTTGPRNFVDLNGNGSWGFNLNGVHFVTIEGGSMQCMDFNNNANYFFIHNLRLACHGNPNILGTNGFLIGTIFDAGVTLGAGATNIKIEQQPGLVDVDSSGNTTNQIVSAASNTYNFFMAGGNTVAWQILQAGSTALSSGTDVSNNPYIRGQNALPIGLGVGATNTFAVNAGFVNWTNAVAPSTPSSGFTNTWIDSTDLRFHDINSTGVIGTTSVAKTCSGQFFTAMSSAGVFTCGSGSAGTVTSVATTGPITGGTITGAGTIACATCVTSAASLTANNLMIGAGLQASAVATTGTGVLTALGTNTGTAGAFVVNGGVLGTPSSGTVTNLTGTASININGTVGATTPTTGAFTTATASTSVSTPIYTSAGSHTFQSNGSTFAGLINTSQQWYFGTTNLAPATGTTLTVSQNTGGAPATSALANILGQFIAADTTIGLMTLDTFGAQGFIGSRYAGGTQASKTATIGATTTFSFGGQAWDGSAYGSGAALDFITSASTWSGTNHGMAARIRTVPDGSTTITEAMRIQASGGVSIGTTTDPGIGSLQVNAQEFIPNATSDAGLTDATACIRTSNGQVLKGSGTLGICLGTSGAQFKTAFAPMAAGIDEIAKLNLVNYRYKEGFGDSGERVQYGLTAQQVETVMPDLVRHDDAGETINFDIGALLPVALHAIQQLKTDNDNLRACQESWKCRIFGVK